MEPKLQGGFNDHRKEILGKALFFRSYNFNPILLAVHENYKTGVPVLGSHPCYEMLSQSFPESSVIAQPQTKNIRNGDRIWQLAVNVADENCLQFSFLASE